MEVTAVLFFLVFVIPASFAFQWTSSSQIPDGSSFRACVGERASFPWSFSLSSGEHVISVEWYRTTGKGQVLAAVWAVGHFLPTAGQNVTFVPGAGLQVGHVSLAEFATYSVRVNYNNNGSLLSSQQTAFLTMEDAPVLVDGQMVASVHPEPVLDDVTGRLHIQLKCGHFLSLGSRPVSVVWKTPSDHTVASTAYINGTFRLNLPHPTQGGGYYCHLKDPSVAARCIPNILRLMRGAYIHVDEVQIRLTLLEGGLQGLQVKDEKLDRDLDRQRDLTAEVVRLAEITDMLLTRTEKLTSDNKRIASDNEKLKTQTEKLTSDNEKLKTQTEQLSSDNEKLKTQTEKLTSDNDGLKSQMQSMASQLTAETANLSTSCVDNLATNTSDISTQLSALKSRDVSDFKPRSCADDDRLLDKTNGVRTLNVNGHDITVYCDQTTSGGGWTVFQRRFDGSVVFDRDWVDYEDGFGHVSGEYWLGLRNIYRMTSRGNYTLRVDLEDFSGNTAYTQYSHFSISGPEDNYRLHVSGYSGTAEDSPYGLIYVNSMQFTSRDRDHDLLNNMNCVTTFFHGGFWYNNCGNMNPNGVYKNTAVTGQSDSMSWYPWRTNFQALRRVEMKIRPA